MDNETIKHIIDAHLRPQAEVMSKFPKRSVFLLTIESAEIDEHGTVKSLGNGALAGPVDMATEEKRKKVYELVKTFCPNLEERYNESEHSMVVARCDITVTTDPKTEEGFGTIVLLVPKK